MIMGYRVYKIFTEEVQEPFVYVRTLSNGDNIGKIETNEPIEGTLTQDEVLNYIKLNHVEPEE